MLKEDPNKFNAYKNLTADYHFEKIGKVATGTLPDGTKFKIDSNKMKLVSKYFFHLNWKGYIYTLKAKQRSVIYFFTGWFLDIPQGQILLSTI